VFIQVWRSSLNTNKGAHTRRKNTTESSYRKPNLCPSNPKKKDSDKILPTHQQVSTRRRRPERKNVQATFKEKKT
jgi:hypothetical protein